MPNALLTNITVISKTSAEWIAENPILPVTQAAYSTDTKELRIGDGVLPWTSLLVDTMHGSVPSHNSIHRFDGRDAITPADIKAAPVDINNKVPVANLPTATTGAQGITQLNNTLTSTSTAQALTAAQGKALKDLADTKEASANKNAANGYAGLDANGKVLESLLPSIALMDTFEAASQAEMLALTTARRGDVCIRSDINKTFILSADGYATLANWKELRTPTDVVLSVAGKTGAVTLVKGDVGLGNVDNTSDANKPVSSATQTALDGKLDKVSTVNLTISNAAPQINMIDTDQGMTRYIHFNGGSIGFLTSAGTWALRVDDSGNTVATGDVVAFSDIRLKKDLNQIQDALSKVEQLTGYTFTRIDTKQRHTGLIAQEVQKVLPEAITHTDEYLTLAYGSLTGLLVEAIKELSARVKELEERK